MWLVLGSRYRRVIVVKFEKILGQIMKWPE